jgi:hypothetical protein
MTEAVVKRARTWPQLVIACAGLVIWGLTGLPRSGREYARLLGVALRSQDTVAGSFARGQAIGMVQGEIVGVVLIQTAVVWAILYFAVVKARNPRAGLAHALILGGVRLALELALIGYILSLAARSA